ncbi:cell division protein FtsQ [Gracilibacillus boraciitolerans JCM 21714]|uniref:Cell division protein DivIB n=1 Tax=Gracilibacillus boraciitolerans JCM 21714 TaxID=1298598 RepID=W4VE98_9BACI|nr:FtsQ-type POTRA domain-containing protein [Gracilibacillus boraciitolerans]GAE91735.1 cell division protein FtsQ [Gracilibacillus boraciitolerans JCM 21714]
MVQKRVVSIEERIPKLKQERRKKANKKLIFYMLIFFLLIFIVVYMQSPMSYVKHISVSGLHWVKNEEILNRSKIDESTNFWGGVQSKEIEQAIISHPQIKAVDVSKSFPNTISINVKELKHIGYVELDSKLHPILENGGELLDEVNWTSVDGEVPILSGFKDNHYLQELSDELAKLSSYVSVLISEIYWIPSDANPYKIKLYMTDGHEVESSIRNLSSTLNSYPSIVSQLDPKEEGVIKIDESGGQFSLHTKWKQKRRI